MEKIKRFLLIFIGIALFIPVINSCKKGAEDPDFSFYSRKHRLCQDWKFSYYKKIIQHNDDIISYEFDGASLRTIVGNSLYIAHADMSISFKTDGTYLWDQTVATDTSTYTYHEAGDWYFTGGGKNSDTKYKELLAMQTTKYTKTTQVGGTTTTENYDGTGNLTSRVFEIVKLASDEVKLNSKVETNYVQASTSDLQILTEIINLKKGL
jgi:YD repeat-containing protein